MHWLRVTRASHFHPHPTASRIFPIRPLNCRFRSTAANMRRSPGPKSRAGAMTITSPPTRRFAPAASRSPRSTACRPSPRRWAYRCAIPAALPRASNSPTAPRQRPFSKRIFALADLAARRGRGVCHRLLRTHARWIADPDRRLQCAGLSPAFEFVRARRHAKLGRVAQQGPGVPQDRPPQAGALLRSRRNRGRGDCRPRAWKSAG